ncbi:hypothetical protein AA309_28865 [Microvirga vignae]|uniref:Uncharacterized protein n=1 Tax=Microvirga vignae TaxID=1225564 RepID=A0A0H1R430_9HYPH|nr:hypothetical protein AA309_28865 [Microvirga vignae]
MICARERASVPAEPDLSLQLSVLILLIADIITMQAILLHASGRLPPSWAVLLMPLNLAFDQR